MSDTTARMSRKMSSAKELQSVVRTMKALAASSIGQYQEAVRALADYKRTVELGLRVCLRAHGDAPLGMREPGRPLSTSVGAVVFGSDQGLVGQLNEVVADFALAALAKQPGTADVWAVGERVHARLSGADVRLGTPFAVPSSVKGIGPLVGRILVEAETKRHPEEMGELFLFYNRPTAGSVYVPVSQRLLPLDEAWRRRLVELPWPTSNLPEVLGEAITTLRGLIREYLFISLFRACAESLASENAARLAAMQRADKNIDDLLEELSTTFNHLRQSRIDEELFDVISSVEALSRPA